MASKTVFQRRRRRSARSNQVQPFFQQAGGETTELADSSSFFAPSIGPVQAKFTVNQPGDSYEQEADAMSEKVVRRTTSKKEEDIQKMTNPEDEKVQKQDATEPEEEDKISRLPEKEDELQKMEAPEEDEKVQKQDAEMPEEEKVVQSKSSSGGVPSVSPSVAQGIQNSKGNGSQLPKQTLNEMSHSFGHDFSGVRIHTDSESGYLNQALQAQAFTQGQDIYFNEGKYNPESVEGKKLLAHELTHVVQQGEEWLYSRHTVQRQENPTLPSPPFGDDQLRNLSEEQLDELYKKYSKTNPQEAQKIKRMQKAKGFRGSSLKKGSKAKKFLRKLGKGAKVIVPLIFLHDWYTEGFKEAAKNTFNDLTWPVSELWN